MEWYQAAIIVTLVLIAAGAIGTFAYGAINEGEGFEGRINAGFQAVVEVIEWPFKREERRAAEVTRAVDAAIHVKLLTISDAELIAIAKRHPDRFEKCLKAARAHNGLAEAFRPLGEAFGQVAAMFSGVADGIAQGFQATAGVPLTAENAELVKHIIRSESVGEHDQKNHRLSIRRDRVWDDFNPKNCRRCGWLLNPGPDPEEQAEAQHEAMIEFGADTCTCGAEDTIQFPPHEPWCAKWNENTGNPKVEADA